MDKEIELKYCPVNKDDIRQKLQNSGFTMIQPEYMMRRVLLHSPHLTDRWARVRQEVDGVTTAIKRVVDRNAIDGTEEIQMPAPSVELAVRHLEACGFHKTAFHESYREIWGRDGLEVTIDSWPGLAPLMEIEGINADKVYAAAAELGFNKDEALFGSIDLVYEAIVGIPQRWICENDLTFDNPPDINSIKKQVA
ncbi:MAG TPA: hypothetical protein VGF14_07985 [Alphaproteobacteria bacterium]